jgi:hypothetical protein
MHHDWKKINKKYIINDYFKKRMKNIEINR